MRPGRNEVTATRLSLKAQAEEGAILLVVLWIALVMGVLGMSFSAAIRTEVNAARNVVDQKQSFYMARAGIEYAVYKILESRSAFSATQQQSEGNLDQIPEVLTGSLTLPLPNGVARIEVADESGKINLNVPMAETQLDLVYNLLIMVGVDPMRADVITDSIADWVDQDDFPSPNGAESDYYLSLETPYVAANGTFQVPEELLLVRGVTPEIYYGKKGLSKSGEKVDYYGLQHYFTTFALGNRINANAAPLPVLAALPYLDEEMATRIYDLREQSYIQGPNQLMQEIPGLPSNVATLLTASPNTTIYGLTSIGQLEGSKVVSKIRCVIQLDPRSPKGYSVLYWNESNTEI
jgi:general secretion pathway protein K